MAQKAFVISAVIKTAFEGAEKGLTKLKSNLNKIVSDMKKVPEETQKSVNKLSNDLQTMSERAGRGIEFGTFSNPSEVQAYMQDLRKVEIAQMKITDKLVTRSGFSKQEIEDVNKQTSAIEKKQKALEKTEKELDDIRQLTRAVREEEAKAASKLGMDPAQLAKPGELEKQMAARQGPDGRAKDPEAAKELRILREVQKAREKLEKDAAGILDTEAKLQAKYKKQNRELNAQKQAKDRTLRSSLDNLLAAKKISKVEYDKRIALLDQQKIYDNIGESVKKASYKQLNKETKQNIRVAERQAKAQDRVKKGFFANVTAATLYYSALRIVRRVLRAITRTVTELDDSFTQIAMVTNKTRKEAWAMTNQFQSLALEVGTTTDQVAKLAVFFARQGRTAEEAFRLTKVAAMAAKVASIDASESANFLTSAINGFGLAIDQAMDVSDKFAALGASSASSYQEMAVALSKVAPSAKVAGVNIDQMLGFLAKGIETTREAPENIGTAFKTVFARMTQLRDFGKTLEEGVAVNTVEEALRTAGVALRDNQGNFRQMGDVLTELGHKFEGLSRNQQAYIATALAGTRQQSRLLAVMQNFDRTMELVQTSTEAAGATLAQHAEYSEGMEAANARLQTSFQKIITSLVSSDAVIAVIDAIAKGLNNIANVAKALVITMGVLTAAVLVYAMVKKRQVLIDTLGVKSTVAMTFAKQVYTVVTGKATIATLGFGKALAVATGGITIILAGLAMLIGGMFDIGKQSEKTSEKVKQLQVDIYNLGKEEKDFDKLVDRFKELEKQTFKTSEELAEMNELLEKIREAGGSEYDFVLAGTLDDAVIEEYKQILAERKAMKQEELRQTGADILDPVLRNGRAITAKASEMTLADRQASVEYIASLFQGFDQMAAEQQEQIRTSIRNNLQDYIDGLTLKGSQYGVDIDEEASKIALDEKLLLVMEDSFETLFTGMENGEMADSERITQILGNFLSLDPEDQEFLKSIYSSQFGNIFELDPQVIQDLVGKGFNVNSINAMLSGMEDSLGDFSGAKEITEFYAKLLSQIDPSDAEAIAEIQSRTVAEISRLGGGADVIKDFVGAITDPMAFENAMNIFRETTNSLDALLEASEAFAKGEIPENFEKLIRDYPELADDIRNGTIDMEKAMEYVTDSAVKNVKQKISDLRRQMAQEDNEEVKAAYQAQIDTLQEMLENPLFLFNKFAEESAEIIEKNYKTQIDFVKQVNQQRKEEIDLMEQKLRMAKSMLDLDRQLAALSRDTSYGAQARARDIQEQQRAAAIEREKLVMDLITEQAISELEKKRDENVQSIKDNVEEIADAFRGRGTTRGGGTLGNIEAYTGFSLVTN